MRNWSNFCPEMGQTSKWSRHLTNSSAMSSVMGVFATFKVWSMSNDKTFFIFLL